jgi:peptide deformylase
MEACLSIPTLSAPIKRHSSIELEWYDRKWKKQTKVFTGFEARVIQHEYDHLEGILYIDKISNIWKQMLEVPLDMIKNKEIKTNYLQR